MRQLAQSRRKAGDVKTIRISDETFDAVLDVLEEERTGLMDKREEQDQAYNGRFTNVKVPRGKVNLKPCPFCGAEPHEHEQRNIDSIFFHIWCETCGAQGPGSEGRRRVKVLWNERTEGGDNHGNTKEKETGEEKTRRAESALPGVSQ